MYITTDVYATRPIRPGDNIAECRGTTRDDYRKVLQFFSDSALENWKEYARRVFTLRNPYTGVSMAEDPAFFALNLDNEAPVYAVWQTVPELLAADRGAIRRVAREKGIYSEKLACGTRRDPSTASSPNASMRSWPNRSVSSARSSASAPS